MYNEIVDGIAGSLEERFPDCRIYREEEAPEPQKPCFFVSLSEMTEKQIHGKRYYRETKAVIRYMAGDTEGGTPQPGIFEVLEELLEGMEVISLPDGYRMCGTKKKGAVENGILYFYVNYDGFVLRNASEGETMGSLAEEFYLQGRKPEGLGIQVSLPDSLYYERRR